MPHILPNADIKLVFLQFQFQSLTKVVGLKFPLGLCGWIIISWMKKILDPMNQGPWKVLISDHLDASGGEKLWYLSPSGLKQLAKKFNSF
jgi:hypothetical protein